eukprot:762883-Hanusia_phi.AAC.2
MNENLSQASCPSYSFDIRLSDEPGGNAVRCSPRYLHQTAPAHPAPAPAPPALPSSAPAPPELPSSAPAPPAFASPARPRMESQPE